MPRLLSLLLCLLLIRPLGGVAQTPFPTAPAPKPATYPLKGRITDPAGQPLPFCNVFIKTTGQNTAANEQGRYQTVNLAPGTYEVLFQYVGFEPRTEHVTITAQAITLDVTLPESTFNLGEVTIRAADEDPAYAIVRAAISRRKYYRDEISSFRCRTYVKGLGRLTDVPGKLLGGLIDMTPDIKPGIIYLSESVSELTFRQPARVQERMISSRVSGRAKSMSFNRAAGLNFDFHDNLVKSGFSERGIVSPIAAGAMTFYRYTLVGATPGAGGKLVNKIEVRPRHRRDPAFHGFIYIQDDTWRLTSLDLRLNQDAGIEYVDEVRVEQVLGPVGAGGRVWRPLSQKINIQFEAFKFKGNANFTTVYSQYDVRPAYPAEAAPRDEPASSQLPTEVATAGQSPALTRKKPKKVKLPPRAAAPRDSLFVGEIPLRAGEVMRVEQDANQRDSAYWTSVRPIPLTEEETRDYVEKDSIETIKNTRPYQDSLDRKRNKPSIGDFLLGGYEYQRTFLKRTTSVPPIFRMVQYNTVEGAVLNAPATYRQSFEDRRFWQVLTTLRYGFSEQRFRPSVELQYRYRPQTDARVWLEGGRQIRDINGTEPIAPLVNSVYTLLLNQNYLKLYERDYVAVRWQAEVTNGLIIGVAAGYADRRELVNHTDRVWRDEPGRFLTPNNPFAFPTPGDRPGTLSRATYYGQDGQHFFDASRIATGSLLIRYQPGQEFITRPDRKVNMGGPWPALLFRARGGIGTLTLPDRIAFAPGDERTRFLQLSLGAEHTIDAGLVGETTLSAETGFFPAARKHPISYLDYRHFRGNQTVLASGFSAGFQLLPYYQYSTAGAWLEAHASHHFNGFFLNKIPALRQLKWQEVATANYLHTPALGHYLEAGIGIEHIFKILRLDAYAAYQVGDGARGRSRSGLRVGLGF
ncbi:MAG: carboxypeptidase-like regulatory domain-containing protein [Hymenobacteraceae bacterium]|nr:carboxypeptidase-like regulatory domain-containing protein [Hymenobacteraceae bacterium]